jgi:hypothetical protein
MGALLRPPRCALTLSCQVAPKALAIPRPQINAFQQYVPVESCHIVGGAIIRLIGAVLLEQNDEWELQHCYMQVEGMAELAAAGDGAPKQIPCAA